MKIGIFGYDFPHYKTNAIVRDIYSKGFEIGAVFLAPKIIFSIDGFSNSIDHNSKNNEIRKYCDKNGIPFFKTTHNDFLKISKIVKEGMITIGIIAGARIINKKIIDLFNQGIINYHPGKIPETSGLDSLYRAIEKNIPPFVTAHFIDERVDAGLLIKEFPVKISVQDSFDDISKKLINEQIALNFSVLRMIQRNKSKYKLIVRPKKNNKLTDNEKSQIMKKFNTWKRIYS